MMKLMDLIRLAGVSMGSFKVHCAMPVGTNDPFDAYCGGEFKEWQEYQGKLYFQCDRILSLIHLEGDQWLFAGVYSVHGYKEKGRGTGRHYEYITKEVKGLEHLTGRAIVQFEKRFRATRLQGERYAEQILVLEIRPEQVSIGDFPGFNTVHLSFGNLRTVTHHNLASWKSALSSVAGIYLVSDTKAGRHYVGSAYGEGGIWQRWCCYAETGHGGNTELRALLKRKGQDYAENFQFAVLEVCDINASEEFIVGREKHWKDVLLTRDFGYNSN